MSLNVLDCRGCLTIEQLDRHIDDSALEKSIINFFDNLPDKLIVTRDLAHIIRRYHKAYRPLPLEHRAIPCVVAK